MLPNQILILKGVTCEEYWSQFWAVYVLVKWLGPQGTFRWQFSGLLFMYTYIITLFLCLAAMSWQVSQLSSCFPTPHSSLSSPVLSVTKRKETLSAHHLHLPHQSSWHCPLSPLYYPSTAAEPESTALPNTPTTRLRPGCCTVFLGRSASGWCTRPGGRPPLPARPKWDNEGRERYRMEMATGLWERSPVPHQSWHTIKIWVGLICQASSLVKHHVAACLGHCNNKFIHLVSWHVQPVTHKEFMVKLCQVCGRDILDAVPYICWSYSLSLGVTTLSAQISTRNTVAFHLHIFSSSFLNPWYCSSFLHSFFPMLLSLGIATSLTMVFFLYLITTAMSTCLPITSISISSVSRCPTWSSIGHCLKT